MLRVMPCLSIFFVAVEETWRCFLQSTISIIVLYGRCPECTHWFSLIIPAGGNVELLRNCVTHLLSSTDYDALELIIVHNNRSARPDIAPYFDEISADPRISIIDFDAPFNFSKNCNIGVRRARGEIIGLINDDVQVIGSGWLQEMVGHALRPEVGVVGAMLYYGNETIQHAGVILGIGGLAGHLYRHLPRGEHGYFDRARLTQNLSCVTAACQVLRREIYQEVGGYNEAIAVSFNDIDFCLKLRSKGYLVVWTPFAELYHLEGMTRVPDNETNQQPRFRTEWDYVIHKWGADLFAQDPYFNPNLRLGEIDFESATVPRLKKPWLTPSLE